MFNRIGNEIEQSDPHHRLRGIHDDNGLLPNTFYGSDSHWNTLGQYSQYSGSDYQYPWCDDCSPPNDANCRGRFATPKNRSTLHKEMLDVRINRNRIRPVINGEYAYYLRRGVPAHPNVVNRGHSHDRATFRKAAWVQSMVGIYIVPGFWRTYYGGWGGRGTAFQPDDLEAIPAIEDLQRLHSFFTTRENGSRREWWKLTPHDDFVTSDPNPDDETPGYSYCLADPGESFLVYTENTKATHLELNGPANITYAVTRFDPRTAKGTVLSKQIQGQATIVLESPDYDDWVFEVCKNC